MIANRRWRRGEPLAHPRRACRRALLLTPAATPPDPGRDEPRLLLEVVPRDHPVIQGERHVRDARCKPVRGRARDSLQLRAPIVAQVTRNPALEWRQAGQGRTPFPAQQLARSLGRPCERDRVGRQKRKPAQRALSRAIEEEEVREPAEADASAERVWSGDEGQNEGHGPTNFLVVPRSALAPGRGRHNAVCSISFASSTSLAVTPPALCVHSFTCTLPQLTARSG